MREIVSGVFTWPWFSAPHGYNFNGYLILDPGGNICIDPVEPDSEALDEIARRGAARIILTNRNHVRAANRVRWRGWERRLRREHLRQSRRIYEQIRADGSDWLTQLT